mgnify:FL=1
MIQFLKNTIFLGSFILFIILILFFYFSEENIKKVNKSRLFLLTKEENNFDLPVLSSDTKNIIIYSNEVENYKKKKKKYNFFDLIKKQSDE